MFGTQYADGKIVVSGLYERGTPFTVTWRLIEHDTGKPDALMFKAFRARVDEATWNGDTKVVT